MDAEINDARISRLEAVVEGLASSIKGLETSVEKYISSQRTNWSTIFTGICVLLLLVFAMNQAIVAPLERDVSNDRKYVAEVVRQDIIVASNRQVELIERVSRLEAFEEMRREYQK